MEAFYVLETENCDLAGKMSGEKFPKKISLGSDCRKRLFDITNTQNKGRPVSTGVDYVEQIQKENTALKRLLVERNKIIELSKVEFLKMRTNMQKVQQQNWHLAQANSHMLAELNRGKDRLKAMEHELGCKSTLLTVKDMELKDNVKKKSCDKTFPKNQMEKCEKTQGEEAVVVKDSTKTFNIPNKRRQLRSQSLGSCIVREEIAPKEKNGDTSLKAEQLESTNEKADNKRQCLRRQSARFISEQAKPSKDFAELKDPPDLVPPFVDELMEEDGDALSDITVTEGKERKNSVKCETPVPGRPSIGRPMRKAAEKVSYKEIPINIKMRRS
ncbi:hypothetical protein GIB67_017174 [Kingdonia uniflora]|uniref:Shugoshin-1 n=1 Tax=Kingdonia uniflora TaxID=39325 RepID=A0A7J7NKA7_9MAGN|nr:hypothetical protein GIB67_017174 [Kingdonia uniflora]